MNTQKIWASQCWRTPRQRMATGRQEDMHRLVQKFAAISFAICQCHFGAMSPKATKFFTSLNLALKSPCESLPILDSKRRYRGPLPTSCSHKLHVRKLIGKERGKWKTAATAAYPPGLCKLLADLIVSRVAPNSSEPSLQGDPHQDNPPNSKPCNNALNLTLGERTFGRGWQG